jgi:hypothetical protein
MEYNSSNNVAHRLFKVYKSDKVTTRFSIAPPIHYDLPSRLHVATQFRTATDNHATSSHSVAIFFLAIVSCTSPDATLLLIDLA